MPPKDAKKKTAKSANSKPKAPAAESQSAEYVLKYLVTLLHIVFFTLNSLVSNNNSVLHLVINKTVNLFTERMTFSAVYTMTRLRSELSC